MKPRWGLLALGLLEASLMSTLACDLAAPPHPAGHERPHGPATVASEVGPDLQRASTAHAGQHEHAPAGSHGNPADLAAYVARLESPERDAWQRPDQVVAVLGLRPGMRVCEIGAGPGYWSLRLAAAVAPGGVVYAVDVEPALLAVLRERIAAAGANAGGPAAAGWGPAPRGPARLIVPVLGLPDDPLLPAGVCDLALLVNTLHHMAEPAAYLRRLALALAPGGRIVNIDFERRQTPIGPPLAERIGREQLVALAEQAELRVAAEHRFLEHQYFIELRPR